MIGRPPTTTDSFPAVARLLRSECDRAKCGCQSLRSATNHQRARKCLTRTVRRDALRSANRMSVSCNGQSTCLGRADVSHLRKPADGVEEGFVQRAWLEPEVAPGLGVVAVGGAVHHPDPFA